MKNQPKIKTLGQLKASGYAPVSVKEELRRNLIQKLKSGKPVFDGIFGFEHTVIPDLERAILSRHNMILLGLRGQAKTRIARLMTGLLDDYIPYVAGSELHDDPMHPISWHAKNTIAELGDDTPIEWLHRDQRYTEKLATPDVSIADLIGDLDPIKAAHLKLHYNDERVIHYGLIPRAHRGIFVINELPDLQARIQVALFNILQEGDMQIRGFKLRLPLDIQFVFTANPEDYTNRGSIVTPLKDRIESQILTHYPKDIQVSKQITRQEAGIHADQQGVVHIFNLVYDLIEQIAFEARQSEYVDQKSGVSARMTITALENLVSAAERRALKNNESKTNVRIGDFSGLIPSITGKIELVYEGEQEGPYIVALNLIGKAIRSQFVQYFPAPEKAKKTGNRKQAEKESAGGGAYQAIIQWFNEGHTIDVFNELPQKAYAEVLNAVPGLKRIVDTHHPGVSAEEKLFLMEFVLHGLAEYSLLSKHQLQAGTQFSDLFSSMFNGTNLDILDQFEEDDQEDDL